MLLAAMGAMSGVLHSASDALWMSARLSSAEATDADPVSGWVWGCPEAPPADHDRTCLGVRTRSDVDEASLPKCGLAYPDNY